MQDRQRILAGRENARKTAFLFFGKIKRLHESVQTKGDGGEVVGEMMN